MMLVKPFEQMLGQLRSNLPRQVKEHEILRIAAELPESLKADNTTLVRTEALKWAQKRTVGRLPEEAWREESFQHLSSGRTCMGVRAVWGESDIWALRIDDPDKEVPGRVWSTEIVVGKTSGNTGLFSLRLLITSPENQLTLDPHSPGIVLQLAQRPGLCAGKYRITAEPTTVKSDADLQALITQLIDPDRKLPLIVLSVPAFSTTPDKSPIDSAILARAAVGLAHVVILPAKFTWGLSEQFGKRLSVFEGASRMYLPGFSADSNPFGGHDLFVPKNPYDLSESANILSRLRWSASRASVWRLQVGSHVLSFAAVRNQSLQRRQEELSRSGASEKELLRAAEQRLAALDQQLEQEQFYSDEFSRMHSAAEERAHTAETQLKSAGFRIQQLLNQIRATGEAPDNNIAFPAEWNSFDEWCDINLAGRVILAPQGRRGLRSAEFTEIHVAAKCLLWLANEFRDTKMQGGEGSLRDANVLPGIVNAHCGGDQFEIEWQGEKRIVDWHIKSGGNTRDPARCLRIYYFWDEASQQSVIASIPAHRRTDAS
jgi:hypothetical protein